MVTTWYDLWQGIHLWKIHLDGLAWAQHAWLEHVSVSAGFSGVRTILDCKDSQRATPLICIIPCTATASIDHREYTGKGRCLGTGLMALSKTGLDRLTLIVLSSLGQGSLSRAGEEWPSIYLQQATIDTRIHPQW